MAKSYPYLPEGYREAAKLDLDNDQKQSVRVNMLGLMLLMPFAVVLLVLFINGSAVSFDLKMTDWAFFLVGMVLVLLVHELVHGLFFKLLSPDGRVKFGVNAMFAYAGNPDVYYTKGAFLIIGLAPAVLLNLLLAAALFFVEGTAFYVVFMLLAVHFSGCAGDFTATGMLMKLPGDALAMDTGLVMTFYTKGK